MKKLTNEDFLRKLSEADMSDYNPLETYVDTKTKLSVRHSCGYEYKVTPNHLLSGKKCPKCGGGGIRNKTTEIFKKEIDGLVGSAYTLVGEYSGVKYKTKMKHELGCGYEFEMRPGDFLRGQRCPRCARKEAADKKRKTPEEFSSEISSLGKGEYTLLSDYINNKEYVRLKHSCGNEYDVSPVNFIKGHRCPKCSLVSSNGEDELLEFIRSIYEGEIIQGDRKLLGGMEVDIYLPEKKIAFEYDGLFWHSEKQGKTKKYHSEKTELLEKAGVSLIHVFEDEWLFKKQIVKSKVTHILGLDSGARVHAKSCTVSEIGAAEKNEFLEKNHIQGADLSSVRLGLYSGGELQAVMTFSGERPSLGKRNRTESNYELVRYAGRTDRVVVGGFGKMMKFFREKYKFNKITTYADLRWSAHSKSLYGKMGFKMTHRSEPSYWYFKPSELIRYHRYSFRKSEIKSRFPEIYDDSKTESEMMGDAGFLRIWDCGNLVYEMKKE
jgi:predicted nucleic-acid-binding Zn-ribbon protein